MSEILVFYNGASLFFDIDKLLKSNFTYQKIWNKQKLFIHYFFFFKNIFCSSNKKFNFTSIFFIKTIKNFWNSYTIWRFYFYWYYLLFPIFYNKIYFCSIFFLIKLNFSIYIIFNNSRKTKFSITFQSIVYQHNFYLKKKKFTLSKD